MPPTERFFVYFIQFADRLISAEPLRTSAISMRLTRPIGLYNHIVMEHFGYIQPQPVATPPNLDAVFAALADPTRRKILSRLADGEASVTQIAQPFAMSQPAISRHLKVLERAGLIERDKDQQRRPARLKAETMVAAVDWMNEFQKFWGTSFDQLDDVLKDMKRVKAEENNNE